VALRASAFWASHSVELLVQIIGSYTGWSLLRVAQKVYLPDQHFLQAPAMPIQQLAALGEQTLANHLDSWSPWDIERYDVMSN